MAQLIDNTKPLSPCKNCNPPERFIGCHSVCPDYKKYRHDSDMVSMQIRQRKMKDNAYEGYKKDKYLKSR